MSLSRGFICSQNNLIWAVCWVISFLLPLPFSFSPCSVVVWVRSGGRAGRDGDVVVGSRRHRRCVSRALPGQHWSVSAQNWQRFAGVPGRDWPALQHWRWAAFLAQTEEAVRGAFPHCAAPFAWIEHTDNILICVEFKLLSLNLLVMQIRLLRRADGGAAAFSFYSYPCATYTADEPHDLGSLFVSGKKPRLTTVPLVAAPRKRGHQSEQPVGDERGRDHGGAAAWMIFVQRGKAESDIPTTLKLKRCVFVISPAMTRVIPSALTGRRLPSCPLWSPSWKSSGSLWSPWWRKTSAQRSRTSDRTSPGTFTLTERWNHISVSPNYNKTTHTGREKEITLLKSA